LPNLQNSPALSNPILRENACPALQAVHLASRSIDITLLKQNLGTSEDSLDIVALR
jgi:hypothetical protein